MTEFIFPRDGSIILVDDKIEDARPIMQVLSQKGLAFTYYDGSENDLPKFPTQKVRLAFFDIQLGPILSSHDYAQNIIRLIDRLIPENNGPYVLVLWSAQDEPHGDEVVRQLTAEATPKKPVGTIRLKKRDFMETVFDNSDEDELVESTLADVAPLVPNSSLRAIEDSIRDNFIPKSNLQPKTNALRDLENVLKNELNAKLDVFQFFTYWESLIVRAAGLVATQYSQLQPLGTEWSQNFRHVLFRMADAQLAKRLEEAPNNIILNNALRTVNATFLDVADELLNEPTSIPESLQVDPKSLFYSIEHTARTMSLKWLPAKNHFQFYIDGTVYPPKSEATVGNKKLNQITDNTIQSIFKSMLNSFEQVVPSINSKLHLDFGDTNPLKPGTTFIVDDPPIARKRDLLDTYFSKNHSLSGTGTQNTARGRKPFKTKSGTIKQIRLIEMEVSPACDYAQKKIVKHRLLPGVAVPKHIYEKCNGAFYTTPELLINGKSYYLVLAYQILKSEDETYLLNKRPEFRVRKELLSDILTNLSTHIGRLGVTNL